MHNQIWSKQVHKLSMPIAQTAVPHKWHSENYLIHFICRHALFGGVIDRGVMKLQVESLNVFLKSITQNVMPRWARVWKYNYDQFECWGRPFWISLTLRQEVPLTRRAHNITSSVFVLMGKLSTEKPRGSLKNNRCLRVERSVCSLNHYLNLSEPLKNKTFSGSFQVNPLFHLMPQYSVVFFNLSSSIIVLHQARYAYSSLLSPFCEAEILECVADALHGSGTTFWLNALQDRPPCCCSLLAH